MTAIAGLHKDRGTLHPRNPTGSGAGDALTAGGLFGGCSAPPTFALVFRGRICWDAAVKCSLIMTVLGSDRPGLVSSLADVVASHGGNWLESRMARLAGQFAGIVRIECPAAAVDGLLRELRTPGIPGLTIQAVREAAPEPPAPVRTLTVDVVGNDRPGIVRELAAAIARAGGNVEELTTGLESAPMSGTPIFRAHGVIAIPAHGDATAVVTAIESLGGDLTVDVVC